MAETILQFPTDFVGVIHRRNPMSGESEWLADAEGSVAIPADALLHVIALKAECLEPLLPVARQVEGLQVNKTTITGAELAPVAHFANLTYFNASKARQLDDVGLRHLTGLSKLQHVDLYCTAVTDAGLASLANLIHLEYLHLGGTRVRGRGLPALRGLNRLARLSLEHMPIKDEALALVECPGLTKLVVFGTRVTPDGVRAFQRRFPRCEIVVNMNHIEDHAQRDAQARELLTLLIQRVAFGHPLKAEDGDDAVAAAATRMFPAGTQFEGFVPGMKSWTAGVKEGWDPDDLWFSRPVQVLMRLPCESRIRITLPNGRRMVVPWLTARGAERRRRPPEPRALAN